MSRSLNKLKINQTNNMKGSRCCLLLYMRNLFLSLANGLLFNRLSHTGLILALLGSLIGCIDTCPPEGINLMDNFINSRAYEICNTEEKIATNLYGDQ